MALPESTVEKFATLFAGRADARGNGKKGVTRKVVTLEDYRQHLFGVGEALGVFPVRDDLTVSWAAIDLDEPDEDTAVLMQSMVPGQAYLEKSPGGNWHIWVFFDIPCPAWVARAILRTITEAAGRPKAEVFPKQDQLRPGMVGNYIQLPLYDVANPDHAPAYEAARTYLRDPSMPGAAAVRLGDIQTVSTTRWAARAEKISSPPGAREGREQGTSHTLHCCAEHIIRHKDDNPVIEGHRNVVLFNLAKMLLDYKEFDLEEARYYLNLVNDAGDSLPEGDIERLFDNAVKGGYTSYGCDDPLMEPYVDPNCPIYLGG